MDMEGEKNQWGDKKKRPARNSRSGPEVFNGVPGCYSIST